MIAYLRGILKSKNTQQIIIDVGGIGYLVFVPLSTFYQLPELEEQVKLFTYTHIREDCWQLFGFWSIEEKETFEILLGVSKIGPKLAQNILSHISTKEFKSAISSSDVGRMNSIPGIGEKTARRLILELKDKITYQADEKITAVLPEATASSQDDAVCALISLGYSRLLSERAINQILQKEKNISIEELIKKALNRLSYSKNN